MSIMNRKGVLVVSLVCAILLFLIVICKINTCESDDMLIFPEELSQTLGVQVQKHTSLFHELQCIQREGKLKSPQDLAKLDKAAWADLINKVGYPLDIPGDDAAEKLENYAQMLASMVEQAYPTLVIGHMINRDELNIPGSKDVVRFLYNSPDFEFSRTDLVSYIEKHGTCALEGVDDKEEVKRTLIKIQRVLKISNSPSAIKILLEVGLESAHDITQLGQSKFVTTYATRLGGVERATEIYCMAFKLVSTDQNSDESN